MRDLKTAFWLKSRDLLPANRRPLIPALLISAYCLFTLLLTFGSFLIPNYQESALDSALLVTSPLWLLWALIPFMGGGGGEVESGNKLAPYPVSPRVHLYAAWVSSFLDFPYLFAAPLLVATTFAVSGVPGVLLAFSFMLGASALGQLGAWAAGALHRKRRGESLSGMLAAIILVGLLSLTPLSMQTVFTYLPPGWFLNALTASQEGNWVSALFWGTLTILPVPFTLVFAPRVVARALEVRAQGVSTRPKAWGTSKTRRPFLAALSMMTASTTRALAVRALLLSVLAIPFLGALAFGSEMINPASMALFVGFASAATVSVNVWGFDASGTQLWLTWPISTRTLLYARILSSVLVLLAIEAAVLSLYAALSGFNAADIPTTAAYVTLTALVSAAMGLLVSTRYPNSVDFDSLRARPTSFPAALLFMILTISAGSAAALLTILTHPATAFLFALLLIFWVVERVKHWVQDGAALSSSFK